MKKNILTTLVAALVYFLCIGVGVLLGNLVDHTGNMFYAPAFSALVGGSVYMILLEKVPRFGAITTIGLVISLFSSGASMVLEPFSQESSVDLQRMASPILVITRIRSRTFFPS